LEALFPFLYLVCFAAIAGGAFALMTQTMRTAEQAPRSPAQRRRHPEAPQPGDAVLYVDLSRERLEELYQQSS
jgi:cell division protein FtsN